jgi:tungstate transport system ATP-binding protein
MEHLSQSSARLLSGGERQRLALVRALACKPDLLLLDEPTASMDPASTAWLEGTLLNAYNAGLTVVMVTHDLNQAKRLASRVLLLHRGRVVEDAAKNDFFALPTSPEARAFVGGELLF